MADELELDLDENNQEEIINRNKKKINSLSEKLGTSEKEKADLAQAKAEAEAKAEAAQKDADFYKGFNAVSAKPEYQGASEFQDKIREKANLGLNIEEATMLVMTKEGKYTPPTQPLVRESAAGGSASTGIADSVEKSAKEMSKTDLRSALQELESKGTKLL